MGAMKWKIFSLLVIGLICSVIAQDSIEMPEEFNIEDDFDLEADEELLREIEGRHLAADLARENNLAAKIAADIASESSNSQSPQIQVDPCAKIHCGAGRICQVENNAASCVCIPECPEESDPRRKVCTNKNETWPSDCEVYKQRCLCDTKHADCKGTDFKHVHIDYYGSCKQMPECNEEDMADFPRRMRDWLFNVMKDLAERDELPQHYKSMEMEAETNLTRRWSNAAVWKWCDLDGYPHDRSVSRHELFPIRAPLMTLEHCIAPFLETCDPDNNHRITLQEWGKCLELNEDDMMERCEEISNKENNPKSNLLIP